MRKRNDIYIRNIKIIVLLSTLRENIKLAGIDIAHYVITTSSFKVYVVCFVCVCVQFFKKVSLNNMHRV